MRLSSTPLGAFLGCPRKFWEEHSGAHPVQTTAPMAFGTVFHALVEFRQRRGRLPARTEFGQMTGAYDDPPAVAARFPSVYEPALQTVLWLEEHHPECFDLPDDAEFEVSLERWDLDIAGVPVRGFLDVFIPSERRIVDWKTRGALHYLPRTPEDFRADPQLCYYAAATAAATGWADVTVEHWNVLRPDRRGPELVKCQATLPAAYLRGVWEYLETTVVPAMQQALAQSDPRDVERNTAHCYAKGPCPHLAYCLPSYQEEADTQDPFALLAAAIKEEM